MGLVRDAVRQVLREPSFAITAVTSLGLGMAAVLAMFGLVDALLFRPLPVANPSQLVRVTLTDQFGRARALPASLVASIREAGIFADVCGFVTPLSTVEIAGATTQRSTLAVTSNCLSMLGIQPVLGRLIEANDDRRGAAGVAIVAYDVWHRDYAGRPLLEVDAPTINGVPSTIVGVTPREFDGLLMGYPSHFILPIAQFSNAVNPAMDVLARLKPGDTLQAAATELDARWSAMAIDIADWQQRRLTVEDASTGIDYSLRSRFRMPLLVLLGVAGLVLMAASTNMASLLLARAVRYRRDTVVRIAMGATPLRLMSEICAQHAIIVLTALAGAILVAIWFDGILLAVFGATNGTFKLEIRPDLKLLLSASAVAVAAVAVFVLVPTWYAFRADAGLLISTRSVSSRTSRLRHLVCGAQIALVIPLIAVCGVVGQRFVALLQPPSGSTGVVMAQLAPADGRYAPDFPREGYYRALLERVQAVPSIEAAALSLMRPFQRPLREPIETDGSGTTRLIEVNAVTNAYFSIMGMAPVAGQLFEHDATSGAPLVAVLSMSAAGAWFGSADAAIGRQIRVSDTRAPHRVVGVVRDAIVSSPDHDDRAAVYTDFWQLEPRRQQWPTLLAHAGGAAAGTFEPVRVAVQSAGREYPARMLTLSEQWRASIARDELMAIVSVGFAATGVILAIVGVYGLLSWVVASRRQEIAVRMALGASGRQAANLIGWYAARIVGVGAVCGIPLAWATTTAVPRLLGLTQAGSVWEPIGLSIAVTVLAGALAVARPALRAWRTDPIESLKAT